MARAYDNSNRAEKAARTAERIAETTERLLATASLPDVTLAAIAEGAGVTVQTVLRHMGSRDGCFDAVRTRLGSRVDEQRGHSQPGDIEGAIRGLFEHYEADGRLILNLVSQEGAGQPLADEAATRGRAYHRAWVHRCFGPCLPEQSGDTVLDALVVATDLYTWKLLRLDLGRERAAAEAVLTHLVRSILESA